MNKALIEGGQGKAFYVERTTCFKVERYGSLPNKGTVGRC